MCNWQKWILPGIVAVLLLTGLAMFWQLPAVEANLRQQVSAALAPEHGWAQVTVGSRDVTIEGMAPDEAAITAARQIAQNIPGVRSVAVNATLPPIAKPWIFNAERTGDKIAISGNYASEASRELLQSAAQAAVPGAKIEDNRTLARGAPQDADLLASYVVAQLAGLGDGKIAISDLAVSVSGRASSVDAYENITGALSAGLPAGGSLTALAVEPAIVDPYEFKARKQAEGILLEGYMPDQATRDAVISAAKSSNPGSAIEDATRIAAGVPDGVDWAGATAFALTELGGLSSGSAAISGSDLSIEGRAADSDSFEAIGKALAAELPGGLKLANAAIGQPLISPWTWSLSAKGGAVDLAGFAPDKATAQRNIADARDRFASSLEIRDGQKLGAGAPAGVNDAYAAAIQVASRLADATVAIENSAVRLSGQAFTGTAANEIRAQFASTLPAGWSATVRIAVRQPAEFVTAPQCQQQITGLVSGTSIRFASASAEIEPSSYGLLDRLSYEIRRCPETQIEIGGHTDADGDADANLQLSQARAEAVRAYLVRAGVFYSRLRAKGYGETRPVADNATAGGKAANRRIEFTVIQ